MHKPELSIVVPTFNEQDSVAQLHHDITGALGDDLNYEMIFVDDGSRDETFSRLAAIAKDDPRVVVVKFRRNHGQTQALAAGIDHAEGRVIVTMDADLQNDPADIPRLLAKLDEGCDIVVGWRRNRQDHVLSRKLPSVLANRLIARVTGVPVRDNGCTLKAFRASLIKRVPLYAEMHRFIPALCSMSYARLAEIDVDHHARRFGQSKYGLSRVYKVLFDLLVIKSLLAFHARPRLPLFGVASVGALLLVATLLIFLHAMMTTPEDLLVLGTLSVLCTSLALFILSLSLVVSLVHRHLLNLPPADLAGARGTGQ